MLHTVIYRVLLLVLAAGLTESIVHQPLRRFKTFRIILSDIMLAVVCNLSTKIILMYSSIEADLFTPAPDGTVFPLVTQLLYIFYHYFFTSIPFSVCRGVLPYVLSITHFLTLLSSPSLHYYASELSFPRKTKLQFYHCFTLSFPFIPHFNRVRREYGSNTQFFKVDVWTAFDESALQYRLDPL